MGVVNQALSDRGGDSGWVKMRSEILWSCYFDGSVNLIVICFSMGVGFPFNSGGV